MMGEVEVIHVNRKECTPWLLQSLQHIEQIMKAFSHDISRQRLGRFGRAATYSMQHGSIHSC